MAQFRLKTLFLLTTAVAVLLWAFFAPPHALGLLVIHIGFCLLPAVTIAGVIFHRGYWRAFFIGMAPLLVYQWFSFVPHLLYGTWAVNPGGGSFGVQSGMFGPLGFTDYVVRSTAMDVDAVIQLKLAFAVPLVFTITSGLVAVGVRWWALAVARNNDEPHRPVN